jgi:hypothetical protein
LSSSFKLVKVQSIIRLSGNARPVPDGNVFGDSESLPFGSKSRLGSHVSVVNEVPSIDEARVYLVSWAGRRRRGNSQS